MTAQSIVCGACAAEVPYGRLSCPSCGELLASVAGSRRPAAGVATRTPIPDVLYEPRSAPRSAAVVGGQLAFDDVPRDARAVQDGAVPRDLDAELPWSDPTTTEAWGEPFDASLDAEDTPGNGAPPASIAPWVPGAGFSGGATPAYLPRPPRHAPAAAPVMPEEDRSSAPPPALASTPFTAAPAAAFAGPGAYVPPLAVAAVPAGPPAPAREYAGHPADDEGRGASARPRADLFDGDARARVLDFARWLSVAGSAVAAVGFLLPWGLVVIGSNDVSYFGRWGIAGPWHVAMVLAVLANLGLALLQNRVPVWLRTGVAGLGIGALLLGLVWPYVTIPALGTGPGAIIAGIGAAALVISGLLALVTDRHAEAGRPV
jgi:hypothetical protein